MNRQRPSDAFAGLDALNRLAFGPDAASLADVAHRGVPDWLEEQLSPREGEDAAVNQRLAGLKLRIKYAETKDWPAADEMRPLQWLDATPEQLWSLADSAKPAAGQEKARPRLEITTATLTRAVYSRWQLREILTDFWHNHFSVNAWDQAVGIALPLYDRDVIRRHCLGNFRQMLEAVARSPAMLVYLNNRTSRAGAPNENFARELFELHTLGRDAYLNALYNRWRDVPGAQRGKPAGYIDQDIYEAARAFTGWGLEDGSGVDGGQNLPRTGRFAYVESRHDNYQKRVLATEFDPYQPAQADGLKVLDLAAAHPATAGFLARKLCMRLVADQPAESLVISTAKVWSDHAKKPDQIARVIRHIVHSREFREAAGSKVKRPLELMASFVRATGIEFSANEAVIHELDGAGQRLFGWPTPTGHPDIADYWLSTNAMRRRWFLIAGLAENWWGTGSFDAMASFGSKTVSADQFLAYWLPRLYGRPRPDLVPPLLSAAGQTADQPIANPTHARRLVAWAAMTPDFQLRGHRS
jgi:uncharacterized protein (DUF1800 family)